MRELLRWSIIVAAAVLVIGLMAEARGQKHHRGNEIGSHGTKVVVILQPPA
jgi:hypothetical protein